MTDTSYKRVTVLAGVVAFMFAALLTRLWFLQVLATDEYRERADGNRVRLVSIQAPRGQILDRNGKPLVTNEDTVVITVDRTRLDEAQEAQVLNQLSELLGEPERLLRQRLEDPDFLPYQPIPVFYGAPERAVAYLVEHPDEFPGTAYRWLTVRSYPHEALAAHVLGYLGEVGPDEVGDPSFSGVLPGQRIGRGGVEQRYERWLQGENGWLKLQVDASGKVLGELTREAPQPGNNVVLSIDWRIQRVAEETLREAIGAARDVITTDTGTNARAPAGAVIVMDPNNGHVLAMASAPSFDPAGFLEGMTERQFHIRFNAPNRNYPLVNRALAGAYPPGSTFKPFVAMAALNAGHATLGGFYPCPPSFTVPGDTSGTVFNNWTSTNFGAINLARALAISCDTVFYQWGLDFWVEIEERGEIFQQQIRRWNFGRLTGIDVPGEVTGRVPDQEWKRQIHEAEPDLFPDDIWYPGDNINLSIGQGDMLATPMQMAVAYSALANGGTLYRPQVGLRIESPEGDVIRELEPVELGRAPGQPDDLAFIREALRGVVQGEGTAASAFAGFPLDRYPIAGKTGTAEPAHENEAPHSWFAAMAPADDPQYVVVALVEQGGHGSEVAAPITRRIFEALFGLDRSEFDIAAATD